MKSTTLSLLALGLLISCGKKTVHKDFYVENPYDNSENDTRFTDIEQRLNSLESSVAANVSAINGLSSSLVVQQNSIIALQEELEQADSELAETLQVLIDTGTAAYNSLSSSIDSIQSQLNGQVAQIAVLNGYNNIAEYLNPCGDGPGYDEVLIRMSNGKVVAYFESGNNRFLSELVPNTLYSTTDSQHCHFKVDIAGNLVY